MRGRKPKPEELKALLGNPGKRKARKPAAQQAESYFFAAPAHLDAAGRALWDREVRRHHASIGQLKESDLATFEMLIEAMQRREQCKAALAGGFTYESESKHGKMRRVHPEVAILLTTERLIRQLTRDLGMSTDARVRMLAQIAGRQPQLPLPNEPHSASTKREPGPAPDPGAPESAVGFAAPTRH